MTSDTNPYDVAYNDDGEVGGNKKDAEQMEKGQDNEGYVSDEGRPKRLSNSRPGSVHAGNQIGHGVNQIQQMGNATDCRPKLSRSPDDALPTPAASVISDAPATTEADKPTWNVDLVERHYDDSKSGETECLRTALKALKVFAAFSFFVIVVLGSATSKATLMLLGAQLGYNNDMVCQVNTEGLALACYRIPIDINNDTWYPDLPPPPTLPPPTQAPNSTESTTGAEAAFWENDVQAWRSYVDKSSPHEQIDRQSLDLSGNNPDNLFAYVAFDGNSSDDIATVDPITVTNDWEYTDTTNTTVPMTTVGVTIPPEPDWQVMRIQRCDALAIRYAWAILLCTITPYMMEFCLCAWRTCFNRSKRPSMKLVLLACMMETIHSAGETIFVFRLLRVMNVMEVMSMVFSVAIFPSLLKLCFRPVGEMTKKHLKMGADVLALLVQIACVFAIPVILSLDGSSELSKPGHMADLWLIPISLLLISFYWWENFIDDVGTCGPCLDAVRNLRARLSSRRDKIYAIACLWKMLISAVFMVIWLTALDGFAIEKVFSFPSTSSCEDNQGTVATVTGLNDDWVGIMLVQMISSLLVHQAGVKACQTLMQLTCFSLPLLVAPGVAIGFFMGMCESWNEDFTKHQAVIPLHLFWHCYPKDTLTDLVISVLGVFFLITFVSFVILTRYIWFPSAIKLARTRELFSRPLYSATFIEPSIALNRRRDDRRQQHKIQRREHRGKKNTAKLDDTPRIIACTTMWKETDQEMLRVLKSIMRLDRDQFIQQHANEAFSANVDAYEFDAHIFFDNAIIHKDDTGREIEPPILNNFVMQLIRIMDQAVSAVYERDFWLDPPVKIETPYGGRLEWTMKGGNKLTAHLKDNKRVRNKKRWSQVMYMYYFLGHQLWAEPLEPEEKKHWAENTYILALDGDIDFRPEALKPLMHALQKNPKVGAACSRIHPTGSGPMIWYQKFEYAIGHWFQKSTEHMIGCVLCSPGCFSLIRGWALLHGNVMKKYAQESTNARHFIQYDLGEDRWLCTLILRQGFRIEYLASADAYTHAPEGYIEFMKQRRRWGPSTLGNITDILLNSAEFVATNQSMSMPYIGYQGLLLGTTLLGPATIFMMIVGALQTAFGEFGITLWTSLLINIVPCTMFIVLCYVASSDTQIKVAGLLSAIYSVIMALVLIGICMSIAEDGWCSPTTIFLLMIIVFFLVAAILHPQEFTCIIPGLLYFILIPCMYFFLVIYSMCNLHLVSWGTRDDNKTRPSGLEAQQLKDRTIGSKSANFLGLMDVQATKEEGWTVQLGKLCKCFCCPVSKPNKEYKRLKLIAEKLVELEAGQQMAVQGVPRRRDSTTNRASTPRTSTVQAPPGRRRSSHTATFADMISQGLEFVAEEEDEDEGGTAPDPEETMSDADGESYTPLWMDVKELSQSKTDTLPEEESAFWEEFIKEYLLPVEQSEEEQKDIAEALVGLRNNITLFFFLINGIFIATVFTLQLQTNRMWITGSTHTYDYRIFPADTDVNSLIIRVECGGDNSVDVEPIGFVFLIIFGVIMVIQFFGMIFHRLGTLWYVLTDTLLGYGSLSILQDKKEKVKREKLLLTYDLQHINRSDDEERRTSSVVTSGESGESDYATIDSIQDVNMAKQRKASKVNPSLQTVFEKRYKQLTEEQKARIILMKLELQNAQEANGPISGGEDSDNEETDMNARDRRTAVFASQRRPKLRRAPLPPIPGEVQADIEMTSFKAEEPTTIRQKRKSAPSISVTEMRSQIRRESRTATFSQHPQLDDEDDEDDELGEPQRARSRTSLGQNHQPHGLNRQASFRRAPTKDEKMIKRLDKKLDQLGQLRKHAQKLKLNLSDVEDSVV